MSSGDLIYAEI